MRNPKISVLMSVYNNESSVDASIRSITDQTYGDFELILWNDASTDESLSKMLAWEKRDKRIRVYSNSANQGLAASLNKALQKSTGQFIARMDGDDIADVRRFDKQVDFLDANVQYAIVGAGCVLFDDEGEWGIRHGIAAPQKQDFLSGSQFVHPVVMMRRDALLAVGGYRVCKETLRTEDYDLFMRMYAKGYVGYNIDEVLLRYYEDRKPRRIKWSLRWSEAKIRRGGFRALGLLPKGLLYVIKPLLVGLIPRKLKRRLQEKRSNIKQRRTH